MPSSKCPTCDFLVPENAERCPQCGRVFGEVYRCPSCYAIAAVTPSSKGYRCAACGKPRVLKPGMTITGGSTELTSTHRTPYRAMGGLSLALAVFGASLSTVLLGINAIGISAAAVVAFLFSALAFRLLSRGQSIGKEHTAHRLASRRESAKKLLLQAALTKEELAEKLGIGNTEADAILTSLAADDTSGVRADVDESAGVLRFSSLPAAPAVRVEDPDAPPPPDVAALGEAEDEEDAAASKSRTR